MISFQTPCVPQDSAACLVLRADVSSAPAGHELGGGGPLPLPGHQAAGPAAHHEPGEHQRTRHRHQVDAHDIPDTFKSSKDSKLHSSQFKIISIVEMLCCSACPQ